MSKPSINEVRQAANTIASLVKDAGGRAYFVGGCVRDSLLDANAKIKDIDIEVYSLSPDELVRILSERFKLDTVGKSFGVLKVHHYDIDVALPRRETKLGLGHKSFDIECDPFMPLHEAAARRDFTINAIYCDPLTQEIVDPYGGQSDLQTKTLRHVSPHFCEDPLRVLRGMQFIARFGLKAAPETIEICKSMTSENLPRERLFEEWSKLLVKGVDIASGLNFLRQTGWVKYYPELESLIGCEQSKQWHPEGDVWNHTCHCLNSFAQNRHGYDDDENLLVGLGVLCHDFGKPLTTRYDPVKKCLRSLGHDDAGVEPTLSFLKRLTDELRILKEVPPLVRNHMRPFAMWRSGSGDNAIRRLAVDVVRIDRLLRVASADDCGRPPFPSNPEPLKWLAQEAERLRVQASAPKPILQGRDLIALGLKPGTKFGEILKKCYEAQLDGAFCDHESALVYLRTSILEGL